METLIDSNYQLKDTVKRMKVIIEAMKDENLSDEEFSKFEAEYEGLEKSADKLRRDKKMLEREGLLREQDGGNSGLNDGGFANLGEFICSVANAQVWRTSSFDSRLEKYEARGQSMGEGEAGGFAVPSAFLPQLMQVQPAEAIVRPRSFVIPAGEIPDQEISMPVLNQTSDKNVYGGVVVASVKEGGVKNLTDFALQEFSLIPHEVAAYIVTSDRLLKNWKGASATITRLLRSAIIGWEDDKFLTGDGVACPKGCYNSDAAIKYSRATAGLIDTADVIGMYARFMHEAGGGPIWIGNPTIIPQLMTLQDANNNYIFHAGGYGNYSASEKLPATLYGIPLVFHQRVPALGNLGDLALCDFKYYVIKNGSGIFIEASPHVYFTSDRTVIRAHWAVDGGSFLTEPMPIEGGISETLSPFIILDA